MKETFASFHPQKKSNLDGFPASTASVAEMSIPMVILTQPTIGLLIQLDLLMLSRMMRVSGTIPMTMDTAIISSILTVRRFVLLIVAMVAEPPKVRRHSTAGDVQTVMKTVGLTQPVRGWQVQVEKAMLGQWTARNGTILMAMDAATILLEQPQMFVRVKQELQLALHPVETAGVVQIPMAMVGRI
jgi:hypothetical protein